MEIKYISSKPKTLKDGTVYIDCPFCDGRGVLALDTGDDSNVRCKWCKAYYTLDSINVLDMGYEAMVLMDIMPRDPVEDTEVYKKLVEKYNEGKLIPYDDSTRGNGKTTALVTLAKKLDLLIVVRNQVNKQYIKERFGYEKVEVVNTLALRGLRDSYVVDDASIESLADTMNSMGGMPVAGYVYTRLF